jgi:hypothetical protein
MSEHGCYAASYTTNAYEIHGNATVHAPVKTEEKILNKFTVESTIIPLLRTYLFSA